MPSVPSEPWSHRARLHAPTAQTNLIRSDSFQPRRARTPQPSRLLHGPHPPSPPVQALQPRSDPSCAPYARALRLGGSSIMLRASRASHRQHRRNRAAIPAGTHYEQGAIRILLSEFLVLSKAGQRTEGPLPRSAPRRSKSAGLRQASVGPGGRGQDLWRRRRTRGSSGCSSRRLRAHGPHVSRSTARLRCMRGVDQAPYKMERADAEAFGSRKTAVLINDKKECNKAPFFAVFPPFIHVSLSLQ